jgi:hypothetical protein
VSHNACRHGFSASVRSWNPEDQQRIEMLAKQFAGDATDRVTLHYARNAAEAQFELSLIRRAQLGLIEQVRTFGGFAGDFPTIEIEAALPKQEPARTAEAARRALPELIKLDRFVRRALASRDGALMQIAYDKNASIGCV